MEKPNPIKRGFRNLIQFGPAGVLFATELVQNRNRLLWLVLLSGLLGGVVGWAFMSLLHFAEYLMGPERWSPYFHLGILLAVGIAISLFEKILGETGNVELMVDNIHLEGGPKGMKNLRALIPISLLSIGAGGALGPEAPLIQASGTLASNLGLRFGIKPKEARIVTITGMASAFTVLFGAPLGGAIFALEILHRRGMEYYEALMPGVLGALLGYLAYLGLTGLGLAPIWRFPQFSGFQTIDLFWALLAGIGGTILGMVFVGCNQFWQIILNRFPSSIRPILGGLGLGLLALWSPYVLTFGEVQIGTLLMLSGASSVLFLSAAVAKILGSTLSLAGGWRGGFIIPLFLIGASCALATHSLIPQANLGLWVTAWMVATNVAVTKTPLGSTLVVSEMAGLKIFPTTLIAALVALLLSARVGMIHTQRSRFILGLEGE